MVGPDQIATETLRVDCPFQLRRKGVETKIVLKGAAVPERDLTLIQNIARAVAWYAQLKMGMSISAIASEAGTSTRGIQQVLPLAFLAPDLIRAALDGSQPPQLSSDRLIKSHIPSDWDAQMRLYGTRSTTCTV